MLETGMLVEGKYKILNKIGQGGTSDVYLALDEKTATQLAVKEVRKESIKNFENIEQLLTAEAGILKNLSHPNLPTIIDLIDTDNSYVIVMDYIEGSSLNKILNQYGALSQENVIDLAKQLCDVLGYLHSRTPAIVYCDLKPSNIMLQADGRITLIDFGTARETEANGAANLFGTVGYAAPEQFAQKGQIDARTDIYSLGATLYHLVTGIKPCDALHDFTPIRNINPTLSVTLEKILIKCTKQNPGERYQTVDELIADLELCKEKDIHYRKKQKRKLAAFITTAILTLVFALISIFGFFAAKNKMGENHLNIVESFITAKDSKPSDSV